MLRYLFCIISQIFVPLFLKFVTRFTLGPIQNTLEELENGVFTLKTHQMFSVHTTLEKFKKITQQSPVILNLAEKSRDYLSVIAFEKLLSQNTTLAFSKFIHRAYLKRVSKNRFVRRVSQQ